MTFDEICRSTYAITYTGTEIIGLYVALSKGEDTLDTHQRGALERVRGILYENLSVADLEDINVQYEAYSSRSVDG